MMVEGLQCPNRCISHVWVEWEIIYHGIKQDPHLALAYRKLGARASRRECTTVTFYKTMNYRVCSTPTPRRAVKLTRSTLMASDNYLMANRKPILSIVQNLDFMTFGLCLGPLTIVMTFKYGTFGKRMCELHLLLTIVMALKYGTFGNWMCELHLRLRVACNNVWKAKPQIKNSGWRRHSV